MDTKEPIGEQRDPLGVTAGDDVDKENVHEGFRYRIIRQANRGRTEAADYAEGSPRHSNFILKA